MSLYSRTAKMNRVVVTGMGLVTPLGVGAGKTWAQLLAGATGVQALQAQHLPAGHEEPAMRLPSQVVAPVCTAALEQQRAELMVGPALGLGRGIEMARVAAAEAVAASRLREDPGAAHRDDIGVCVASGMAGVAEIADAGVKVMSGKARQVSPYFVPSVLNNMAAGAVSMDHGFRGPMSAVSTACATGLHAIGHALVTLQRGDAPVMLAGSAEACIDAVSLNGFCRMRALSTRFNDRPTEASRPFDALRDGFVMGEGAGVLVMETLAHAAARGAPILAEIQGFGTSSDASHVSRPPEDGGGAALAMQRALDDGLVRADEVSYINAHATSTPRGDAAEVSALITVFGRNQLRTGDLRVTSTKGALGHLLGAAGSVEAAATVLAAKHLRAPRTVNLAEADDGDLLGIAAPNTALPQGGACMCNSFGFGGVNASLVITPFSEPALGY